MIVLCEKKGTACGKVGSKGVCLIAMEHIQKRPGNGAAANWLQSPARKSKTIRTPS